MNKKNNGKDPYEYERDERRFEVPKHKIFEFFHPHSPKSNPSPRFPLQLAYEQQN
jgi:hypothetical protein